MTLPTVDTKPQVAQTGLDWQAYYREFSEMHGDQPILFGGHLLFEDGWRYSSTDHGGPEFPPPAEPVELNSLLRAYWMRRKALASHEQIELGRQLDHYREMQSLRKVPLQQFQRLLDMESKRWTRTTGPLNLEDMDERLRWLTEDVEFCKQRLREVEDQGFELGIPRSGSDGSAGHDL